MNQQLLDYINQSRQAGKTDEEIKKELLRAGWIEEDIEGAFYIQIEKSELLPQQTLKSSSKLFPIILIVIVLLVMVGYFVSAKFLNIWPFVENNHSIPAFTSRSTVEDLTTDWQTYTNTEYGFKIEYPPDWIASSSASFIDIFNDNSHLYVCLSADYENRYHCTRDINIIETWSIISSGEAKGIKYVLQTDGKKYFYLVTTFDRKDIIISTSQLENKKEEQIFEKIINSLYFSLKNKKEPYSPIGVYVYEKGWWHLNIGGAGKNQYSGLVLNNIVAPHVYDEKGNHTGVVAGKFKGEDAFFEENEISGSLFNRTSEQYLLILNSDHDYKIEIDGVRDGFSYVELEGFSNEPTNTSWAAMNPNIVFYYPGGYVNKKSRIYMEIPKMNYDFSDTAKINIPKFTIPNLRIDLDGDGTIDIEQGATIYQNE